MNRRNTRSQNPRPVTPDIIGTGGSKRGPPAPVCVRDGFATLLVWRRWLKRAVLAPQARASKRRLSQRTDGADATDAQQNNPVHDNMNGGAPAGLAELAVEEHPGSLANDTTLRGPARMFQSLPLAAGASLSATVCQRVVSLGCHW
jgi:hypothetical protein